jgi:hypothetical protein
MDNQQTLTLKAVSEIGAAFAARTGIEVDPQIIADLPEVREYSLIGDEEYSLRTEDAIASLMDEPSISNALIRAEVKAAEMSTIQSEIKDLSPQQRLSYARKRGLDHPRQDTTDSMTMNEHMQVLQTLKTPQQRLNYARRHGIAS